MNLRCGIVGLPNVGKSTLFNALTQSEVADAENYPFCTIEPNVGVVAIHDKRLDQIAKIGGAEKTIYSTVEFVDIAGLVKGASKGAGLGNKFLSHIREVDAIAHVVRCFVNGDVIHVSNTIDPIEDINTIETELILADLNTVTKQKEGLEKKIRTDSSAKEKLHIITKIEKILNQGQLLGDQYNNDVYVTSLNLITTKPMIYICNVDDNDLPQGNEFSKLVYEQYSSTKCLIISASLEVQLSAIKDFEEREELLQSMDLKDFGINKLAKTTYNILGLTSYFTVGPKEARSWTFKTGAKAPEAAGVIHSDFERGFICAEVTNLDNYVKYKGMIEAKKHGAVKLEGKDYIVQDGDIILFRFNV